MVNNPAVHCLIVLKFTVRSRIHCCIMSCTSTFSYFVSSIAYSSKSATVLYVKSITVC